MSKMGITDREKDKEDDNDIKQSKSTVKELLTFLLIIILVFILIIYVFVMYLQQVETNSNLPEQKQADISQKPKIPKKEKPKPKISWEKILKKIKKVESLRADIYTKIMAQQDPKVKAEAHIFNLLPPTEPKPSLKLALHLKTTAQSQTLPILPPFPPLPNIKIALLNELAPIKLVKNKPYLSFETQPETATRQAVFAAFQQSLALQQNVLQQLLVAQQAKLKVESDLKQAETASVSGSYDFFANTVHQHLQIRQKPLLLFAPPDRAAKPSAVPQADLTVGSLSGI